jgi:diguanylate cyclase (GGDEF)-like protein
MTENKKFHILIVDDENANIAVISEILRGEYAVSAAKTGQAALKMVIEDKPDLILLDILMPDMNGFEVLAKLQEMDGTIPVIFISGLASVDDEEKGLKLGAVDYISKPFINAIVKARVGTHIKIINQMRTIERLGMIDALTDIPNRRFFDMRIEEEWRRTCRRKTYLSMLMIDVDKFKVYNDTYGHPQGDLLLKSLAKSLTVNLRRPSDIAARFGGEEFAVLLADTDVSGALIVAENIRATIKAEIVPRASTGEPTSVTVSIGVNSLIPTMDLRISEFIEQADKNLYAAKAAGRNRVVS